MILHGLLGMLDNWLTFGKLLSQENQVFLIDQRNHGRSAHDPRMSYSDMVSDLKKFMQEHQLNGGATLIGHSMGGKTAMQFVFDHPSLVTNLIVIDIAPREYNASHSHIFEILSDISLENIRSRRELEALINNALGDARMASFLMKNLRRSDLGYEWKMNLTVLRKAYYQLLQAPNLRHSEAYQGTAVFYRGADSDYIRDADEKLIKGYFPNSEIITVPNAGHWLHVDNLRFFLDNVKKQLNVGK